MINISNFVLVNFNHGEKNITNLNNERIVVEIDVEYVRK